MTADLLIDTSVAIWFVEGDERARRLIGPELSDDASTLTVSVTSWIEIAIKHAQGRLMWSVESVRSTLVENGFLELPINAGHARCLETLPQHHGDPFDRLLLAQAQAEDMTFVTADRQLARYRDVVRLRGV